MQKAALYTSGAVFAAVVVAHVVRLTTGFEIVVGGIIVPVWVSFLGALIARPARRLDGGRGAAFVGDHRT